MTSRRIFGIIILVLASFLTLATIGMLSTILKDLLDMIKIFTGTFDGDQVAKRLGHIFYWILHFGALTALWLWGERWAKKSANP